MTRHGEAPGGGARFLLFHRNVAGTRRQGAWMGWERKRGKLHELNALLRGSTGTSILRHRAGPRRCRPAACGTSSRSTPTPDSLGAPPRGSSGRWRTRSTGPRSTRAPEGSCDGHAVLQPRVTTTLPPSARPPSSSASTSGAAGIDPYASAVSDVYQDLFGEGTYTGKGIYDLDVFERALVDRAPENTLLSHDLLEGTFARAGLVTDIELFDESPSRYEEAAARQHRWARGDWQLLPWILGRAHSATGQPSRIPGIARWKMIDNLRRTLVAPAALATLLAAWTMPSASAGPVDRFRPGHDGRPGVAARAGRTAAAATGHLEAQSPSGRGGRPRRSPAATSALGIVFLAHQAVLMLDAILRTLARRLRHPPRPARVDDRCPAPGPAATSTWPGFYRSMAGAVAVAVVPGVRGAGPRAVGQPASRRRSSSSGSLSPLVARWVSLTPRESADRELSDADARTLRLVGRRTWRFFETFVGPQDNALPPDNFQEDPAPVVAHRTSPTNIGLYLLSTVTARDLGWIGTREMAERLEATLATIGRLERVHGHLYNWYDTRDLRPLEPAYVSTVDSGNLCGHLLAVSNACREMLDQPLPVGCGARRHRGRHRS